MLIGLILLFGLCIFLLSLDLPPTGPRALGWKSRETIAREDWLKSRSRWTNGTPSYKHGQRLVVKTWSQLKNKEPGVIKFWDARKLEAVDKLEDKIKKKLSELTDQKPLFEFEGFVIKPFDPWNLWMENPGGEGTTIMKAEFLATLDKLFKRNF